MKVTNATIALITNGLRKAGMSQAALADELGHGRAWASKLMKGKLKSLSEEDADRIEELLDISFIAIRDHDREVSGVAETLSLRAEKNADLAEILVRLENLTGGDLLHDLPYLPTKDLVDFGKEITRAAHEDPGKPGKVGKVAVLWLAERLKDLERRK